MMKHLALGACLLSPLAFAVTESTQSIRSHELVIAPTGSINSLGITSLGLRLGYHYSLSDEWQVGLTPSLEYFSIGPAWQTQVMASVTYNLFADHGFLDSPFVTVGGGVRAFGGSLSGTNVLAQATIGKRFNLFQGVSYRPSLTVSKISGENPSLRLEFLSFSLAF